MHARRKIINVIIFHVLQVIIRKRTPIGNYVFYVKRTRKGKKNVGLLRKEFLLYVQIYLSFIIFENLITDQMNYVRMKTIKRVFLFLRMQNTTIIVVPSIMTIIIKTLCKIDRNGS